MAEKLDLTSLLKNKKGWVASLVSLILGLGLGTTLGREVLDTAGIPASCVRAIQRAGRAIDAGTSIADDSKAALSAVTDLRFGVAGDLAGRNPRQRVAAVQAGGQVQHVTKAVQPRP